MANRRMAWKAEYAKAGQSAECGACHAAIQQDLLRLGTTVDAPHSDGVMTVWHHAGCIFNKKCQIKSVDDVEGLDLLRWEDQQKIKLYINGSSPAIDTDAADAQNGSGVAWHHLDCFQCIYRIICFLLSGGGFEMDDVRPHSEFMEKKLEEQRKALWHVKDELEKHVSSEELKEMLEANNQDSQGSEYDLRDCCADGMIFGALDSCPVCFGSLRYTGEQYRCHGYVSAWSKCSYSTLEHKRIWGRWRIPQGTKNKYLLKWFKSQKAEKSIRILPPSSAVPEIYDGESLYNLKVAVAGEHLDEIDILKKKLQANGAKFYSNVSEVTSCLVWHGEMDNDNADIRLARRMKIPIVRLAYLEDCVHKQKKLPFDLYSVEISRSRIMPVQTEESCSVHEASGLQSTTHILKEGKRIYSVTLSNSDFIIGVISYYILQVIQEDEDSDCYLFRKWGRIGDDRIGATKLEKMPKNQAIREFKLLFLKQTSNSWDLWIENGKFKRKPGKFSPVDVDYDEKFIPELKELSMEKSQLTPQLKELMSLICDSQIYRTTMIEYGIDLDVMPIGKLTADRIMMGSKILTVISNLLHGSVPDDPTVKKKLIIDANDAFFSVIPSTCPQLILDDVNLKAKIDMLKFLWKIEDDMRALGINIEDDKSLDENYKKLRCDIVPLPHDSDDYKLVEKYLVNSHDPMHNDWDLKLEEVFALDRKGESEKYASCGGKLHNKMLLWQGTRLTNILGILGRGLRISPKKAPGAGYKFGNGVYFTDLVSMGARYCRVKEGVGLLLLAEVALGDMYELTQNQDMEKPPKGKHSTKGIGQMKPSASEYTLWRHGQVMVPCGKPTPTHVETKLSYNEYIVYDTAQVKLQFLVKVRFHPRR